ncbi:MAG: hypothetical protein HY553_02440 [Elusimicrobia bacterium]|nr:hypothetical protein [Elusimicrobiota bacterium]
MIRIGFLLGCLVSGALFARAQAAPWRVARGSPCPDPARVRPEWSELAEASAPATLLERHRAADAGPASPLLIETHAGGYWLGLSHRGAPGLEEQEPSCFLKGTVAYYVVGREREPEIDFVRTVREGREESLGARLVELRWFDPQTGRRRRWRNLALARSLGWLDDGAGRQEPGDYWPNPFFAPVNALY